MRLAVKVVVCIRLLFVTTRIVVVVVAAATTMSHRRGVVFSTVPRRRTLFAMITTSLPNNSKVVSTHEQRVPSQIVVAAHTRMRDTSTSGGLCSSRSSLRTLNWNRRTIERVRTTMSSSTYSSLPSSTDASLSSLFGDEKFAYAELTALSKRIRALDESYYGANDDDDDDDDGTTNSSESKLSDDEYDALARREAELCIAYPHLQVMLERKTGLGSSATRYGGRVGRIIIVDNDETSTIEEEMPTSKTTTTKKKKTTSSRIKSTTPKRIKRQHLVNAPMLSLDNAMNDMEAISWLNRVRNLLVKEEALDIATSNSNAAIINDDTRDNTTTTPQTTSIKMMTTTRTMQILAEPKIDGLGLSLRYRLGDNDNKGDCNIYHFIWGATRGDGTKGEDVTEAVRSAWMMMMGEESHDNSIHSVPYSFAIPKAWNYSAGQQRQQPPYELEIRGEVVLPKKAFADLFLDRTIVVDTTDNDSISSSSSTTPTFSNARNAASGILLRSKDSEDSAEAEQTKYLRSQLRFYAYDFVASPSIEENDVNMSSTIGNDGIEMRDKLTSLGFCVPSPVVLESIEITAGVELDVSNISNLIRYHHNLMAARDGNNTTVVTAAAAEHVFPFQIDGVVYKLSSFNDRRICGSSSRAPRWAIAHKFPSTSAVTRLLDIEVQVGRTGALTPVAIFEPVSLSGVMVSRASLHNFHFARKLLLPKKSLDLLLVDDKGSIGVKKGISLLVGRAGDVIPQVKKRIFDDDHDDDDNNIAGLHSSEMISLKDPHLCPACGSPATFDFVTANTTTIKRQKKASSQAVGTDEDKSVDEDKSIDTEVSGQVLRCSGPQLLCPPRAVNGLAYAYSKAGLDVKGLSKAKIGQLMEGGIIRFPADLFAIYGGATDNSSAKHDGRFSEIFVNLLQILCIMGPSHNHIIL